MMSLFPLRRLLSPETTQMASGRPGTRPTRRRRASRLRQVERLEGRTLMSVAGWVDDYGGTGSTGGNHAVAVDTAGDVYTLGRFTGTAGPNGGQAPTLTSAGAHDVYVVKYLPDGTFAWAQRMGGPNDDLTGGIAVDGSGNVYATGYFQGTADFGSTILTAAGYQDVFVTKLDAAGNFLWAEHMGGTGGATRTFGNIALDSGGNLYLAGEFQYTASFGGINLTATVGKNGSGTRNAFVAKVDGMGHVVWAQRMGGEYLSATGGVAADGVGGVYVTGDLDTGWKGGTATFGALRLTAPSSTDQVFVTKLNQNGQFLWAKVTGGSSASSDGYGIAANAGNIYVTGDLGSTTSFGAQTLTASGNTHGFVTRLDPATGAFSWARSLDGYGHTVAEDAQGNASVGGFFSSTASFGGQVLTSAGGNDGFVARLDSAGNFLGAWQMGGTGTDDEVGGVAVDSGGVVYAVGWYSSTVGFDTGDGTVTLTSAGPFDSFVLKRDPQ